MSSPHRSRPLCKRCRLRHRNDYYGVCIHCAAKASQATSTNVKLLVEQANNIARPLRASKRLTFGEVEDELIIFCRGDVRFIRFKGLSFRVDFLSFFDVEDLEGLTVHHIGNHGLKTLLHRDRRCVRYTGDRKTTPILERVVVGCPREDGSIIFMCTSQDRGVTPFRLPGESTLPEVYEARLELCKDKSFMRKCRTCQEVKECFEFRWKHSSRSSNYERRCRACVTSRKFVYKAEYSTASPSTSDSASVE